MTDIALFIPSLRGGGAERVTVILANELAARGYAVDLVAASAKGPYRSELSADVRLVDLKAGRVFASLPKLVRYLRTVKPQSMLSALGHANVVAVLARLVARVETRIVVSQHNNLSQSRTRRKSFSGHVVQRLLRWAYTNADSVVAVSQGVADDLASTLNFQRSKVEVVYNPVVTAGLFKRAAEKVEHSWLRNGEPPVILGVGRLTEPKDFATLIKAFKKVRENRPCRLVILGEGELRNELEALVRDLHIESDVMLPGFVENPFSWMRQCGVFVLSSATEGLPTVLIEALASGAKVVSTDCPSGPREILESGKWGVLTPVGDVQELAKAIQEQLDRPEKQFFVQRVEAFSAQCAADGYVALLLEENR